ncbi:MAG: ABC transporter ATP-binding protein, partial [Anaerolineales bacterium]
LVIPTRGTAAVHGYDVVRASAEVRRLIGLVFSNENSFYGRLTGRQNLEFFAALQNLTGRLFRTRSDELFDLFGLRNAADAPFQSYSTGMRQKLNVARALLHDPQVIFLDEPTKGMDVLTAETLRNLLRAELVERRGKTVLLTTHDLDEMEAMCDRVGVLQAGQLRAVGRPADLIGAASATVVYRLELAGASNGIALHLEQLAGIDSVVLVSQTAGAIVLDVTLNDPATADASLWETLAAHGARVKRYGPRDEGLVELLREHAANDG